MLQGTTTVQDSYPNVHKQGNIFTRGQADDPAVCEDLTDIFYMPA